MSSRLRKKTANYTMVFDSIVLKSGDVISFEGRTVSNKPWYQISHDAGFSASSYYDGPDFERAFDLYREIVLAFQGVSKAEEFAKRKSMLEQRIQKMIDASEKQRTEDMYDGLKRNPMFLGMSDF